jgi:hypothetical protein
MKRMASRTMRFCFALAAPVFVGMFILYAMQGMRDRDKVAKMTEKMKTVCVGRFLIDVPVAAEISLKRVFVDGFDISRRLESQDEWVARIAGREAELKQTFNKLGRKNLESARDVHANGFAGRILIHGRVRTYGIENDQRVYTEIIAIDGYAHKDGVSFDLIAKGYDPKRAGNVARLIGQLAVRAENEIPAEPGFCIDRALIRDPLSPDQTESVTMFAGLPGYPDMAIVFSSMAGTKRGPGMLERNAAASAREPFYVRAGFSTVREGIRSINGLQGEELVLKVRESNFTTGFSFDWEMGGRYDDVYAPLLTLELETGTNPRTGGKPVQSSLSETALLDLWDKLSSSVRLRPASAPEIIAAEPVTGQLGTYVSAGGICPHTGWWLCSQGGDGVGVLGGQRQYLKKGQRVPQALLLPPQTLWQKVRGVQPSYESNAPTPWKLVDKRSRPRTPAPVPLAPATLIARPNGLEPVSSTAPAAPLPGVGSFVKTGSACPASGWWRCEESHALDGTRWFAQGSLLPAATFRVPPRTFGRSANAPEVISRRSLWQLMRHAQASERPKPGAGTPAAQPTPPPAPAPTPVLTEATGGKAAPPTSA